MTKEQVWAVVPAAGIGSRMRADKPKQYLDLDGCLVIEHTLQRLASHPRIAGIAVAIAEDDPWWPDVQIPELAKLIVVTGGQHRADSVFNALKALSETLTDNPWVLVHDAARPCIRHQDIDAMLDQLASHDVGGILGVPVTDTVKRANDDHTIVETVERHGLWRASTPQMFRLPVLKQALQSAKENQYVVTDEASAIELAGLQPRMVEGHADNIKITLPQDLALASLFIKQQRGEG
jgi:2-C-methyl-D-erythritol 4-phosphate cytidylyltransferase